MRIDILDLKYKSLTRLIQELAEECCPQYDGQHVELIGKSIDNMGFFKINNTYVGSIYFNNSTCQVDFEINDLRQLDMSISYLKDYADIQGRLNQ